ncbi:cell wall hydrolase [uncultured Jannaschia sp.]|uniref:cell wall hydrolase n=1 Tax=uncultured Jannaschia sp. TaxID=293347 RepID=UPI0026100E69|nr:cell wall hydrolase [uncultured Jannaschia sp.]
MRSFLLPLTACACLVVLPAAAGELAAGPTMSSKSAPAASAATDYAPGARACLAEAVYFETKGTSLRAGQAVAYVILNRRAHEEFPPKVCDVVADGCQFSYQCDGQPERMADPAERERAFRAAESVLEGRIDDPTEGALFFHAEKAVAVDWFETRDRTVEIGGNVFYR